MPIFIGQLTPTGTGLQSYTGLDFLPDYIEIQGAVVGTGPDVQARGQQGIALADGTQRVDYWYADGSGRATDFKANRCIVVCTRNTNIDIGLECEFVQFDDLGGGQYGFTLDQHIQDLSCPLLVKAVQL